MPQTRVHIQQDKCSNKDEPRVKIMNLLLKFHFCVEIFGAVKGGFRQERDLFPFTITGYSL